MNQDTSNTPIYIAPCIDDDEMHARVFPIIPKLWREPESFTTESVGTICWHIERCAICQDELNRVGDEEPANWQLD